MVASAVVRAAHLAVAGIEVATLAEGEAVRLVWAEELFVARLHQGDEGGGVQVVDQLAVDGLDVDDAGVVVVGVDQVRASRRCHLVVGGVVDRLEPDHVAVALDGVAAEVEGRGRLLLAARAGGGGGGGEPEGISGEESNWRVTKSLP